MKEVVLLRLKKRRSASPGGFNVTPALTLACLVQMINQ